MHSSYDFDRPRAKVLLVDGRTASRAAMRQALTQIDAEICEAENGPQALEVCAGGDFALILMDVRMPGMDGFEVAARLCDGPLSRDTALILTSAEGLNAFDQLKGYGAGAVDCVTGTLDARVLCAKVRNLIELYESRRALKRALRELDEVNANLRNEVDERKRAEARAQALATHDTLTGLPNRLLFIDRLAGAIARARRERTLFALGYMDLDGFKPINDLYGHRSGDAVLAAIAARLSEITRVSDTVARLGGDEFALIFEPIADDPSALRVGEKLRRHLSLPLRLPAETAAATPLNIGVSIGLALYPQHGADADALMHSADCALYAVKNSGKAGVRIFQPTHDPRSRELAAKRSFD